MSVERFQDEVERYGLSELLWTLKNSLSLMPAGVPEGARQKSLDVDILGAASPG
jgi:hypothetical protein